MGEAKGDVLPPAQGGGIGHQGKVPNGLHGMHRRTFLEGHGPPLQWPQRFYGLDKAGELLPKLELLPYSLETLLWFVPMVLWASRR